MKSHHRLKDPNREKSIYAFRTILALIFVFVLSVMLVMRLYQLQVIEFDHFTTLSDKNRMQLQSIAPIRGLIYDRNGVLLAENLPVFSVALIPEDIADLDQTLADITHIIEVTPDQIDSFKNRLGRARRPFQPVILKSNLNEEEIASIEVRRHQLLGVEVQAELARHYPLGETFAHAIGYVGRINESEAASVDEKNYSATNYIGKNGVELFYEAELHGTVGYQKVETNAGNQVLRILDRVDPVPGVDLILHLDARLQAKAIELLGERRGAVVAIEPSSGGILALVSTPSFDPNLFVTGIDARSYSALRDSLDLPLFNRALKGQYPPGSTIKPIIGLAGLDSGVTDRNYAIWDPGFYMLKNNEHQYRDWKRGGHGRVNLFAAISQSCDTYFYDLAFKMGVDTMSKYMEYFGFGQNTSLDVAEAREGILPSREWKQAVKGQSWYPGDSLNMGIGQGYMLATPLQLATATSVLATKGQWRAPRLAKATSASAEPLHQRAVDIADVRIKNADDWEFVVDAMAEVMHGAHGTARATARQAAYRMAGKTGTAQVVAIKQGEKYNALALDERHRDHALFVGFAPVEEPKIAVAILVENGGGGSSTAAPVARALFDEWLVNSSAMNESGQSDNSSETPESSGTLEIARELDQ